MTRNAITVENLSKAYRIGLKQERADSLIGLAQQTLTAPFRNFRQLRRLDTLAHQDEAPDLFWALKDVSFEVPEGEVLGVIGRNGAGKSTLLKVLSRITEPTAGRAVIRGRVASLLEVGTGFHPELSGRDNIYMNGTILGMTKREIDRKLDQIVDFSGVEKFLDTPVKRYSSGMRVRLGFAVAAHLDPEILIVDEVLAVGDAHFQQRCLGKMQDVARSGRTVLFVSHNMTAVKSLCAQALLLDGGRLEGFGALDLVIGNYLEDASRPLVDDANLLRNSKVLERVILASGDVLDTKIVELGSKLRIILQLRNVPRLAHPTIGIGVDDEFGGRVLTVHSPLTFSRISSLPVQVDVHCEIDSLPLRPGDYSLKVAIHGVEEISGIGRFRVVNRDAFGDGRGYHLGSCVAASNWWTTEPGQQTESPVAAHIDHGPVA